MRPRVGVSACLLGERVRWDGRDKLDRSLADALSDVCEVVPVCPEVELGMGVPREPIQLVRRASAVVLEGVHSKKDYTQAMSRFAGERIVALAALGLSGYVVKARSPSCGKDDTALHDEKGEPIGMTAGLFTMVLGAAFPSMPIEDDEKLRDPERRKRFLQAVFERAKSL
jgi:uncharacterized protein YbbK (DUF523 family)